MPCLPETNLRQTKIQRDLPTYTNGKQSNAAPFG